MVFSPGVETREILLPSLDTVHGHCVAGVPTTRYHHCVSVRVRDGAGIAVKKQCYKLNINPTAFNTYYVSYLSEKPGSWVPSGFIRVVVL